MYLLGVVVFPSTERAGDPDRMTESWCGRDRGIPSPNIRPLIKVDTPVSRLEAKHFISTITPIEITLQ